MASGYKLYEMIQAFGFRIYFFTTYSSESGASLVPLATFFHLELPPVDPSSLSCFSGDSALDFSYKLILKLFPAELLQPK